MGVSVETAVILVSDINKLRLEEHDIRTATREASLLRLRPIMMTALVACLGFSGGTFDRHRFRYAKALRYRDRRGPRLRLFLGFFVNPVLYELVAREGDVLKV